MTREFETKLESIVNRSPTEQRRRARAAINRLLNQGVESVDSLILALQDETLSVQKRATAGWALGQLQEKTAVSPLLNVFTEGNKTLFWECAKSLGQIKSRKSVLPLVRILSESDDPDRRTAAAYTLGLLRDRRAVQPLLGVLGNSKEEPNVRGHAAEALAHMEDDRAVAPLIAALRDRYVEVRFWSAFALGQLGAIHEHCLSLSELRRRTRRS
jgi:HEAT repeat protein